MTEPNEILIKEVYARFGLAYYESECLYRGLCNLYTFATFDSKQDITGPRIEEKFAYAFSKPLGIILHAIEDHLPESLYEQLQSALDKRNFLAHHFWFKRCHLMFSKEGQNEMLEELLEYAELFSCLDKELELIVSEKMQEFGVTEDVIQGARREILEGKPWDPLPTQRVPKKQERIVQAWDVPTKGESTLLFQSDDGCLWQLCEVGLGWTRYDNPLPDWKANKRIKEYLPTNINPRPKTEIPWNFEFKLAKGTVLWVKKGEKERTFKWGIRKAPS
jgi:hypothetical protein